MIIGGTIRRSRLALALLTPVLVVVASVVIVSLVSLARLGTSASADAGLARVGDDLALVIVTDGGDAAATRETVFTWGVLVPILALAPATAIAWSVAGRVHRTVDEASAEVEAAEAERQSRLQEVVHELRTPLAVMGTNLELAASLTDGDPTSTRYIDAARRAVTRMGRTVDDLSGHGRLSVETDGGPVDLAAIAEAIVAEQVGPATARGVTLALVGSGPMTVGSVDPAAVRTAAGNFLTNAVRLGARGSEVAVDWGDRSGWAWLAVTDQGPGLAPAQHARVFERGWQGSHDRDRPDRSGAGLGLTIARQLTEAQGGAVTLDSTEGVGSTFTLWLPLDPDADRVDVVSPDQIHPLLQPWLRDTVDA